MRTTIYHALTVILTILSVFATVACGGDDGLDTPTTPSSGTSSVDPASIDSTTVYELPVIFHVLYADKSKADQYIPAARLKNLLQYVNEIYQGNIYGKSTNAHLKFILAETDENGKKLSTPGVEYRQYTDEYPIDVNSFMSDNTGDKVKYIWDPNQYINVMMFNFKQGDASTITLGISHMPYTVDKHVEGLDNVATRYISKSQLKFPLCSAINSLFAAQTPKGGYYQSDRYTNSNHTWTQLTPSDIVVTLAHELGHYLGLYHAFTESATNGAYEAVDSCGDTDYCKDTPSYNRFEYLAYTSSLPIKIEYLTQLMTRHSCKGQTYEADNIMDYSWTYGFQITPEQRDRIRNVLYYSPLIPGPKKNNINVKTRASEESTEPVNLNIHIIK